MKKDRVFIPCLLIVSFSSALIFFITASTRNIPSKTLLFHLATSFYQPHHNSFLNNNYFYIYQIVLLSVIAVYILKKSGWRKNLPSMLSGVLTGTLLITMALQTTGQTYYFIREFRRIDGKKTADRYPGALKKIVDFAGFCKQKLPGKHSCQLITDLDMSRDPGMFFHRTLAYHLYPIDIRDIRRSPADCAIVFIAQNPQSRVPKDYDVIESWGEKSLLAIKGLPHP